MITRALQKTWIEAIAICANCLKLFKKKFNWNFSIGDEQTSFKRAKFARNSISSRSNASIRSFHPIRFTKAHSELRRAGMKGNAIYHLTFKSIHPAIQSIYEFVTAEEIAKSGRRRRWKGLSFAEWCRSSRQFTKSSSSHNRGKIT